VVTKFMETTANCSWQDCY